MSFQIKNYKSIVDTGVCRLSESDNITILAGQNESGKSSILQAIRDFENGKTSIDTLRIDGSLPVVTCTYKVDEEDFSDFVIKDCEVDSAISDLLKLVVEISIIKHFSKSGASIIRLSSNIEEEVKKILTTSPIKKKIKATDPNNPGVPIETIKVLTVEESMSHFRSGVWSYTPILRFFDDFCALLPNKITLSDLISDKSEAAGYSAVKNIEKILETDFKLFKDTDDTSARVKEKKFTREITADFNEKWKQKTSTESKCTIYISYSRDSKGSEYLSFHVETNQDELLTPIQRSAGFRWFLSFYLQLKADHLTSRDLIILFDEPGLYLHATAQKDMLKIFEEVSQSSQIIYSTHSPYLIDARRLDRLKLVINTGQKGTIIEKITSDKISNKRDSLKPIIDAIGLEVAHAFAVAKHNNVIVEGISDYYYLTAMKQLICPELDFVFLPSMGADNAHLLMELCIGWGLNWIVLFDGKGAQKAIKKINSFINDQEEVRRKIHVVNGKNGIEDLFDFEDLNKIFESDFFSAEKPNSDAVNDIGGKELSGRIFLDKVNNTPYTKEDFDKRTIKEFEDLFSKFKDMLRI